MAPIVHEYTADANVAGPYETRQARNADTGGLGSAIAKFGGQAGAVSDVIQKREAQSEITSLNSQMAQAHADFTGNLDDTLQGADPNDSNISEKFMQSYDDQMGQVADNISTPEGRQYFEKANSQMRAHFQIKSMQGQAALAGDNAVQQTTDSINQYSTSLMNDPGSFESIKGLNGMAVQAMVENGVLPENAAAKLTSTANNQFAKAAVRGTISLDPNSAKQQLAGGAWDSYITGDEKYTLQREADQGISAQGIEQKRQQSVADQQKADAQTGTQNQFLQKMVNNQLSTNDVLHSNLEAFGTGSKEQFIKMIQTAQTEGIKTNPVTYQSLFNRIHLPDGDPNKITDENALNSYMGKGLNLTGINQLRGEIQNRKTDTGRDESDLQKTFLDVVKDRLVKSNPIVGLKDPGGEENYLRYMSDFYPAFQAAKKAGKSPTSLLTPGSPDYMGNNLSAYARSSADIIRSMRSDDGPSPAPPGAFASPVAANGAAAPAKPAVEPRRPGETPSQYRTRVGK